MKRATLTLLVLLLVIPFSSACKSDSSTKTTGKTEEATAQKAAQEEAPKEDVVEAPGTDYYKTIPFGKLSAKERETFVKVAKAELCPCDNSTVSLDECLKDKAQACDIAIATATVAMQSIHAGNDETDTLAAISQVAAQLKKVNEFDLEGRPYKGAADAKVTIVEFADYQCPFCKIAAQKMEDIAAAYEGKPVAIYYKHFPLPMHEFAEKAAYAAVAAQNQGKFWEMSKLLFENQTSLSDDAILKFAKQLGLNIKKFQADMKAPKTAELVAKDKSDGEKAGLQGTPTFYINGRIYTSSPDDEAALKSHIDRLLEAN